MTKTEMISKDDIFKIIDGLLKFGRADQKQLGYNEALLDIRTEVSLFFKYREEENNETDHHGRS